MNEKKTITDIQLQQKRKERFSIFLDGEFAFGLHQDVLIKAGIAKGDQLSEKQIENILELEERRAAKEKAYRLLAVRPRSKRELTDRLERAGFAESEIEHVLNDLIRLKLVNDREFAMMFARNRMITKPCGEFLLTQELRQKGIGDADIALAVREAYKDQSEYDFAWQVAAKSKKKQIRLNEEKAQKRVADFLMRRGFHWDIVKDVMEHWDELDDG
jgi:regulatory protein